MLAASKPAREVCGEASRTRFHALAVWRPRRASKESQGRGGYLHHALAPYKATGAHNGDV